MSEMIERVARTLCVENGVDPDKPSGAFGVWWKGYESDARAAIEAMREPTTWMIVQGSDGGDGSHIRTWQDMIDAALGKEAE